MEHFLCQVVFSWLPEAEGEMYRYLFFLEPNGWCFCWKLLHQFLWRGYIPFVRLIRQLQDWGKWYCVVFKEGSGWHLPLIHTSVGTASSAQVYHSSERLTVSSPVGVRSSAQLLQWAELKRKKKSVSQVHGIQSKGANIRNRCEVFPGENKALFSN